MGTKGVRSRRGKGEQYDQPKSKQVILLLTEHGSTLLDQKVKAYIQQTGIQLSRSEYFERWARNLL
jgi:hypothetical protein